MKLRNIVLITITLLIAGAVFAGVTNALGTEGANKVVGPENVRDYTMALDVEGVNYFVDGGELLAGKPGDLTRIATPHGVIVNAVAEDAADTGHLYIGAANELAIYRSTDGGDSWTHVRLDTDAVGSVTDIAVDSRNRLVYVGTDTDGLHRFRDVGSSMIASGHLLLDEAVEEVVASSDGQGLAFVRTRWNLYRAEETGLRWIRVDALPSPATAIAMANSSPAAIYVGTASTGLRMSVDGGKTWQTANAGLNYTPGTQLYVHDVAVDPVMPNVVYVSSSVGFGSASLHVTPMGVAMSTDAASLFETLTDAELTSDDSGSTVSVAVTDLMPVSGQPGALFALTDGSRSPVALGTAEFSEVDAVVTAGDVERPARGLMAVIAWILAGLAGLGLLVIVWMDTQRSRRATQDPGMLSGTARNRR